MLTWSRRSPRSTAPGQALGVEEATGAVRVRRFRHSYRAVGQRGQLSDVVPIVLVRDQLQADRDGRTDCCVGAHSCRTSPRTGCSRGAPARGGPREKRSGRSPCGRGESPVDEQSDLSALMPNDLCLWYRAALRDDLIAAGQVSMIREQFADALGAAGWPDGACLFLITVRASRGPRPSSRTPVRSVVPQGQFACGAV